MGTTINVLIICCAKNMQQGAKIVMENNKKVGEILAVTFSQDTFICKIILFHTANRVNRNYLVFLLA